MVPWPGVVVRRGRRYHRSMITPHAPIALVIPALNEAASLPAVLAEWVASPEIVRVVVVDNGSTDDTARVSREGGAEVVTEPRRGYGSACLAGIQHLLDDPPEILVICDADGADDPADLPSLLAPLRSGEAQLVVGSRTLGRAQRGALTPQARVGNRLATFLMAHLHHQHFTDLGPFRAIKFQALLRLGMVDPTWGWNVEMQLKALANGLKVVEIPVGYRRRLAGNSKISGDLRGATRAGIRILWAVWHYR